MGNLRAKVKSLLCKNSLLYRSVRNSGLFDYSFYYRQNPDVEQSGQDALVHFVSIGATEGRNPNPLFDLQYYQSQLTGQENIIENPLLHYCRFGASAGLNPHPLFHTRFYQQQCEDNGEPIDSNPLFHFFTKGFRLQLNPHPLFDYQFFLIQTVFADQGCTNALVSYLSSFELWNIDPHPLFDVTYYKANDQQVASSGMAPLLYYLLNNQNCPADPHPLFQGSWYQKELSDVAEQKMNPLVHYLMYGQYEGRNPFKVNKDHSRPKKERPGKKQCITSGVLCGSGFKDNAYDKTTKKKFSVIVWGRGDINSAVLNLQKIFQSVSSVDWEIVICSTSKQHSVRNEHAAVISEKIYSVQYCHSVAPLVQSLQKASMCAKGDFLIFLKSEMIARNQDWLCQFLTFVVRRKTALICCKCLENGYSRRQQLNQALFQEAFGLNSSASILGGKSGEEWSMPTVECMVVMKDVFTSLHGFNPLYEHYYFELDFVIKALSEGVKQRDFPDSSFLGESNPVIAAGQSTCSIDRLLFLDSLQELIEKNLAVSRASFNLASYMKKRRDEICRKQHRTEANP